ncbi:MAG: co-chaperone GroES [Anaerolineae bacterium]
MPDVNLRPLGDRIVIEPDQGEERTESGLFIPETAKEKPQRGTVIAVGAGARKEGSNERIPLDVAPGDVVLFGKYAGTDIKLNAVEYKILKESDVLAIVEE